MKRLDTKLQSLAPSLGWFGMVDMLLIFFYFDYLDILILKINF